MSASRMMTLSFLGVLAVVLLVFSSQLFEVNHAGYVQVKQAATTGEMTVRLEPGIYPQLFGTITEFTISDVYDFHDESKQIALRFNDAATANVSGQIRYKLPVDQKAILRIMADFRADAAVHDQLVKQVVENAIRQTASLFSAEEVYSLRRADFVFLVNEQIKHGLYATTYKEVYTKDEDGNNSIKRTVLVKRDDKGEPVIAEDSLFNRYGIELLQVKIDDPKFDDKTNELIAQRKQADQEKVVAKAQAERAKQDTITAVEKGKANIAIAEATALVQKKTEVIAAEKEKEVAAQQALKAEEEKKAKIARGEGEAAAAKLLVAAGLTPMQKAEIDMKTAIGVAAELAKVRLPGLMVIGSDGKGTSPDPFMAVGLESLLRISKGMANQEAK